MAYSAVTQPLSLSLIQRGTSGSIDAVQRTRVPPIEINTEPGVDLVKPSSSDTGRSWSWGRSVMPTTVTTRNHTSKVAPGVASATGRSNVASASATDLATSR